MHRLIKVCEVVAAVIISIDAWGEGCKDSIHGSVVAYADSLSACCKNPALHVEEFGLKKSWTTNDLYLSVVSQISNNLDFVCQNLPACATNQLERYIVLSVGEVFEDDLYICMLDKLLSYSQRIAFTTKECNWYLFSSQNARRSTLLQRKYYLPAVSNVINKLETFTEDAQYYSRIRTGRALEALHDYLKEYGINE